MAKSRRPALAHQGRGRPIRPAPPSPAARGHLLRTVSAGLLGGLVGLLLDALPFWRASQVRHDSPGRG